MGSAVTTLTNGNGGGDRYVRREGGREGGKGALSHFLTFIHLLFHMPFPPSLPLSPPSLRPSTVDVTIQPGAALELESVSVTTPDYRRMLVGREGGREGGTGGGREGGREGGKEGGKTSSQYTRCIVLGNIWSHS